MCRQAPQGKKVEISVLFLYPPIWGRVGDLTVTSPGPAKATSKNKITTNERYFSIPA